MPVSMQSARNGASSSSEHAGEVRTFAAGQVPEGWQQISGTAGAITPGSLVVRDIALAPGRVPGSSAGIASRAIMRRHDGRTYILQRVGTADGTDSANLAIYEVDSEFKQLGRWSPATAGFLVSHPNLASLVPLNYPICVLSDGNLLRIGGRGKRTVDGVPVPASAVTYAVASPEGSTNVVTRFNASNYSVSAMANLPGARTTTAIAQAGNGKVYFASLAVECDAALSGGAIIEYDYARNVHVTAPVALTGDFYITAMSPLSDGRVACVGINSVSLLVSWAVFNPQTGVLSAPVAVDAGTVLPAELAARKDDCFAWFGSVLVNSVLQTVVYLVNPQSGSFTRTPLSVLLTGTALCVTSLSPSGVPAVHPRGGTSVIHEYHAEYTPSGVEQAVKGA